MKQVVMRTSNRMLFESGFKTFDKQADLISTGNVMSNVQASTFVRAYNETECNGFTRDKGVLQDFDLKLFAHSMSPAVRKKVCEHAVDKSIIVYKFRHWHNGEEIVDGFVLTETDYHFIESFATRHSIKSLDAVSEAAKYVSDIEDIMAEILGRQS